MKYNKIDVAVLQLEAAILAYRTGRSIEAITLAGASEEIFGVICKRKNIAPSIGKIASLPAMASSSLQGKYAFDFLNMPRNCLKHAGNAAEDEFEVDDLDPYFMIVRAIINLLVLDIEMSAAVKRFCFDNIILSSGDKK